MLKKDRGWAINLTASILEGSINQREIENSKYNLEAIADEAFTVDPHSGEYALDLLADPFMEIARKHRRA